MRLGLRQKGGAAQLAVQATRLARREGWARAGSICDSGRRAGTEWYADAGSVCDSGRRAGTERLKKFYVAATNGSAADREG